MREERSAVALDLKVKLARMFGENVYSDCHSIYNPSFSSSLMHIQIVNVVPKFFHNFDETVLGSMRLPMNRRNASATSSGFS